MDRSGVSPREKMKYSINVGGVTNVPEFELKVKIILDAFNSQKESRTVGHVINNGVYSG
ncbi:MAG: hypothetical protein OEL83_16875 [Desulforhopalus sp.]|nr:hypothetical protein [Desulforhopalus sp.]